MTAFQAALGLGFCFGAMFGVVVMLFAVPPYPRRPREPRDATAIHARINGVWVKIWSKDQ